MAGDQLELEIEGLTQPRRGQLRATAETMVDHLRTTERVDVEHLPMIALLYKLADALETSSGRGASTALLSAQFQEVWEKLASLPLPESVADEDDDYDVVLLPGAVPDAG